VDGNTCVWDATNGTMLDRFDELAYPFPFVNPDDIQISTLLISAEQDRRYTYFICQPSQKFLAVFPSPVWKLIPAHFGRVWSGALGEYVCLLKIEGEW
jgi:hypothetical protein